MTTARRGLLGYGLALGSGLLPGRTALAQGAAGQAFPSRPLRLIVAFTPGGPSDVIARILGNQLGHLLGQPVVIENRPGAGGNVAGEMVAKATPDGITLLMANNSILAANSFLYRNTPFDPLRDFAPIALIGSQPNVLVVNPTLPVHSLAELTALAKARPGALNYASSGSGTAAHLAGELYRLRAQVDIVHVAYRGAAPALTDLVDGRVQLMFATSASVIPLIQGGALRPLAVTTPARSAALPNLPTVAEAGLPGFDATTWHGIVAPAGTPVDIVLTLATAISAALQDISVKPRLTELGVEFMPSTPESFAGYIRAESASWGEVIRTAGIRVD
ncbi:Bug family tripartite tricarboxylate transporter substrate binding protein [Humitalea sp. 24SJ18S-53]|uniref:Bug family tripartite tricarboxylate transporter substrate binding protein n=1 Tax=Humitalea sp. 24SJ18S-53 TaxID=3422307 RepID=UPI003D66DF49